MKIIHGALSRDHVHRFVEIPPHIAVSDFVRQAKGRSSRKIQQEFHPIQAKSACVAFVRAGF
ncbi:MAG: transposase [Parasphingorhabdus sp.]